MSSSLLADIAVVVFAKTENIWCRVFTKALSSSHEDPTKRIILDVFTHFLNSRIVIKMQGW
jgi:hypothetical protein